MTRVIISYSHKDRRWLDRLLTHLRPIERTGDIEVWADTRIKQGANWIDEIEAALSHADIAVLLVSADFLASDFIATKELPRLLQAARHRGCSIVPVIVGACMFSQIHDLQQFEAINSPGRPLGRMKKPEAEAVLAKLAATILDSLTGKTVQLPLDAGTGHRQKEPSLWKGSPGDAQVDDLIRGVKLADWDAAADAALQIIVMTTPSGGNAVFASLLEYQDRPDDDDRLWGALHTIESCVRLVPSIINRAQLSRMAAHTNFSVRSSAASICMELAHSAPHLVPLDLVIKLSVYDEDWYVETPANAALKAMARSFPAVLQILYGRLRSSILEESAHAASAILDIAKQEPGLLEPSPLRAGLKRLKQAGHDEAFAHIAASLVKMKGRRRTKTYRYGL